MFRIHELNKTGYHITWNYPGTANHHAITDYSFVTDMDSIAAVRLNFFQYIKNLAIEIAAKSANENLKTSVATFTNWTDGYLKGQREVPVLIQTVFEQWLKLSTRMEADKEFIGYTKEAQELCKQFIENCKDYQANPLPVLEKVSS
ncbi:MAG: hypothetical protein ABL951_04120 [Alphaproteobacteria bacterium]